MGKVTATDGAGNTGPEATTGAADVTAPVAPTVDQNNAAGLGGTTEPNAVITVELGNGSTVTTTADSQGNWLLEPNPLAEGEVGKVTATDGAGNSSTPTMTDGTDITAPVAPTVDHNNAAGLGGTTEPNAVITVELGNGSTVTTTADSQGNWNIKPNPIAEGESATVIATDKAGNTSAETPTGKADTVAPTAPGIDQNNESGLSGTAEPESTISVELADGTTITTTTDTAGNWSITPNPLGDGEVGKVTATDAAGNNSAPTMTDGTDITPPAAPGVDQNNGEGLSGTAEAGATVTVKDADGNTVTTTADSTGHWSITPNPISDGMSGTVTATDEAGNESNPSNTGTADTVAPNAPLVEQNNAAGLAGTTEPNAVITVDLGNGSTVTTMADSQGHWSIEPNPLETGEVGKVTATDAAGNTSTPTMTDGTDITPPAAPGIDQNNGEGLSGTAEAGATVTVKDADGNTVTTTADSTGHWSITPNPIADGTSGTVTATDEAGNESSPSNTGTADTVAPNAPLVEQNNAAGLAGTTEPNAVITVDLGNGSTVTTMADSQGHWSIEPNPLETGEVGKVTATDAAGNTSTPTMTDGTDITPPAAPGVDQNNGEGLSGTAEAGATVTVKDADGNTVTTTADSTGHWSITPNPITDGSEGSVTATDAAGNTSAETPTGTADTVAPTAPGIDQNNGEGLSGTAEAGATVTVKDADGNTVTTTADSTGHWSITPNPITDGTSGTVTATDEAGNESSPSNTGIADTVAPTAPGIDQNNGEGLSGTVEAGATVIVKDADGNTVTTTADSTGHWSITPNPLADGSEGSVTATDAAGNTSAETPTGTADTVAPTAPGIDQNNGEGLSGTAEAGATVTVKDADGNTVTTTADSTGHWSITPNPITDGTSGTVTATDEAGNESSPTNTGIADTVAPTAPGIDQNNGEGLTGTAEAGSTVIVKDADGNTVTTTADSTGHWSITPNPITDGSEGSVTATDAAGNTSAETPTGTADLVAPDKPLVNLVNGIDPITGTAEPNSIVTVTYLDGTSVTVTASSDGSWSVLNPGLEDGDTITVTATDEVGNKSESVTVTVDTYVLADTVIITNGVTNDDTPAIVGTAEANSIVTLTIIGTTGSQVVSVSVDGTGVWTYTPTVALAEDVYTLSAIARDSEGRVSQIGASSITVDTTPPSSEIVIEITAITDDSGVLGDFITNDTTPTIHGTITGTLSADEHAQISIDNGVTWINLAIVDGKWSYNETRTSVDGIDQTYTYQVRVVDNAGNVGSTDSQVVKISTTVPDNTITVTTLLTADTTPTISGAYAKALGNGETIQVIVNGVTYKQGDGYLTVNTTAKTWSLHIPDANALNVNGATDTPYSIIAQIVNIAGNVVSDTTANELTVYQDVSISAGPSPDYMGQQPLFNGMTKIGAGEKLEVYVYNSTGTLIKTFSSVNGASVVDGLVFDATTGSWKITAANWGTSQLAGGSYTVQAKVVVADGSGGQISDVQAITVIQPIAITVPNSTYSDINSKVYALDDGGYLLIWAQNTNNNTGSAASNYDLVAQRYTQSGVAVGSLIKITNTTTGTYANSEGYADRNDMWDSNGSYSANVNGDGSFTIAYNYDLATQSAIKSFDDSGNLLSTTTVNSGQNYYFGYNYVETTNGKVVVFTSGTIHDYDIFIAGSVKSYSASNLTNETNGGNGYIYNQYATPTGYSGFGNSTNIESVSAVSLGGSLVLVQYADYTSTDAYPTKENVMIVDYSSTGVATVLKSAVANYYDNGWQIGACSFVLKEGGFVSLWAGNQDSATSLTNGGTMDGFNVYSRRFSYDVGANTITALDTTEKMVNTTMNGVNGVGYSTMSTGHFSGCALAQGGYVVVWTKMLSNSLSEVYSQSYDAAGNRLGGETLVSTQTVDGTGTIDTLPTVTALKDGGYVVSWTNSASTSYAINSTTTDIKTVIVNGDGTLRGADETHSIDATYLNGTGTLIGTDGVCTLDGRNGATTMIGGKDNDNIIIKDINFSHIDGGAGNDTLIWDSSANLNLGDILDKVQNIETIHLGDANANTMTVSIDDILQMTSNNTLIIQGGDTDKVQIVDANSWTSGGTQSYHGADYQIYTATTSDNHLINLWIQNNLGVIA
ncbi:hypothetical protein KPC_2557 [Acinetobacter stercoris]|uniref:Type I secretion C-terminal target domain-containing protein n=1 Tax=Acinetobacter stercoris TaxID=2126983 RepID=A0A2U3N1E5_9GAMM|nr:hypothetical protein KPC_2557 [Acinetobacter stercoris]